MSTKSKLNIETFGSTKDGDPINLYTLNNNNLIEIKLINYGGIITNIKVPDLNNNYTDIVLGYDNLENYLRNLNYFGAIIGRCTNRIENAEFELDEKKINITKNNNKNHLHGGLIGFNKVIWNAKPISSYNSIGVKLSYLSKNGEEGYPGNLNVNVTYALTNNNELKIDYYATTDKPTIINLTHHSYFNLKGHDKGNILDHQLKINANKITSMKEESIVTGELENVENTPMDFTKMISIGSRINQNTNQLKLGAGYDHNWALNDYDGHLKLAAELYEPTSKRLMEVYTTEPGIQLYTGNFIDGIDIGKNNTIYRSRSGLCLETQHFPNSCNEPTFPSIILRPNQEYKSTTIYKFTIK